MQTSLFPLSAFRSFKAVQKIPLCLAAAIVIAAGGHVVAAPATWSGATSGTWTTTTNWSGGSGSGGIPGNGDSLSFTSAGTSGATTLTDNLMTASTYTLTSITFTTGAAAFTINPATSGTLTSSNGFTLGAAANAILITNLSNNTETINDYIVIGGVSSRNYDGFTINTDTTGGNVTLGGTVVGTAFGATGGGTVTLSGTVGLSNSIGNSTLLYAGNNTTLIISGTLGSSVGSANYGHRLGILAGGTLEYSGSAAETFGGFIYSTTNQSTNPTSVAAGSTLEVNGTGTLTINGGDSFTSTFTYANLSVLQGTFSDATSYDNSGPTPGYELGSTGTITLGSGSNNATLNISTTVSGTTSPTYTYASPINVNGTGADTIMATSTVTPTFTGSVTLGSGSTLTVGESSTGTLVFSGPIGGSGGFATSAASTGTVLLTGTDTYTGATVINGGTLQLGNGLTNGSIANTSTLTIGTGTVNATLNVNATGSTTIATPIMVGGGAGFHGTPTIADLSNFATVFSSSITNTNTGSDLVFKTKSGGGNITLTGSYTGADFDASGTGTLTTTGPVLVNNQGTFEYLAVDSGATYNVAGPLTAFGSTGTYNAGIGLNGLLVYTGTGNEVLTPSRINGNANFDSIGTGTLAVNSATGTLTLQTHIAIAGDGYTSLSVLQGTLLDQAASGYGLELGTTGTITVGSGANNATLNMNVGGSGTYTSAIAINGTGTDLIENTSSGSNVFSGTATLASGSVLDTAATSTGTLNFSGPIGGSGGFSTDAASTGTVLLTGTDTYTGATVINGGTLQLGNGLTNGSIANTSTLTIGTGTVNATLNVNATGSTTIATPIMVGGGAGFHGTPTIADLSNFATVFSSSITNTNTGSDLVFKTKSGGGNITLTGSYTGADFDASGTGTLTTTGPVLVNNQGTFEYLAVDSGATYNVAGPLTAFGSTGTYNAGIGLNGLLVYTGTGNEVLTPSRINGNANFDSIGTGTLAVNSATGTLTLQTHIAIAGDGYTSLSVLQGTLLDQAASGYGLELGTTGTITVGSGANNATLNMHVGGSGTYTSAIAINGTGTDLIENTSTGSNVFSGSVAVASNSTLNVATTSTGSLVFAGAINGGGALTVNSGTVTLLGGNTYTGNTTISSGALVIGGNGSLGASGTYTGNIIDNGLFNFNSTGGDVLTGVVSGTGSVSVTGASYLYLSNANSYTGNTVIGPAGNLIIGNNGTSGSLSTSSVIIDNGSLAFYRTNAVTQGVDFSSAAISGTGNVQQGDTGTLTLSAANTYTGGTDIFAGVLNVGGSQSATSGALGNVSVSSDTVDFEGGTLQFSSANTYDYSSLLTVNALGNGATAYNIDTNGQNVTFASGLGNSFAAGGAASLNKFGSGTLTLAGPDTYTGGTTVAAGALQGTTASLEGNITDSTGAVVAFNQSTTGTYSGVISGGGAVTVAGGGSVAFSNANSYTGGTSVNSGALFLNNTSNSGAGTGSLTVAPGATLGGTGSYGTTGNSGAGFTIAGTGTATRANVLVGMGSATDANTSHTLSLFASGTSTITNANLTFNLNAQQAGALGSDPSGSGTELSVGNTAIAFGTNQGSVQFSLNLQNEPAIIGAYTPYVLIAGTLNTGGGGVNGSQYTGLTLGNVLVNSGGVTETIITGNNLQLAFGNSVDQQYYGANSYLVLYQSAGVDDIDVVVVPEPGTWALMIGGLAVLIFWQRRNTQGRR